MTYKEVTSPDNSSRNELSDSKEVRSLKRPIYYNETFLKTWDLAFFFLYFSFSVDRSSSYIDLSSFFLFFLLIFHSVQRVMPIPPKSNFGMATVYIPSPVHNFSENEQKYRSQCVRLYVDFNLILNRCNNFTSTL